MTSRFYVFASPGEKGTHSPETVFHKVDDEVIAKSLCSLFTKQFTGSDGLPSFEYKAVETLSDEDQILMDEALDSLAQYDDPDRFIYDSPPSQHTINLATWARRADKWEDALRARGESRNRGSDSPSAEQSESVQSGKHDAASAPEQMEMSPEDRKNSGLAVLLLVAQAYYKLLEAVVSMASWVAAVDLNLNQSYLWTVMALSNLLRNHEDLKDFPEPFEPAFPDLFPSTIRDAEWEDEVALHAEAFLSAVQRYVISKGLHEEEGGSPGWWFIELYRPSVNLSIERANAYHERMRQACKQMLGGRPKNTMDRPVPPSAEHGNSATESTQVRPLDATPNRSDRDPTDSSGARNAVFLSYSHKDEKFLKQLVDHLKPLERQGRVSSWSDLQIRAGSQWFDEIQRALSRTRVAVLLVTKDFLASDFIDQHELGPFLRAAEDGGVTILWVLVRDCNWRATPLSRYQAAYPPDKPLAPMKADRDTAWVRICDAIVSAAGAG